MNVYLLGAGASYGYDDTTTDESRIPPLTNSIFSQGNRSCIFTKGAFPELYEKLEDFLEAKGLDRSNISQPVDVEEFLSWLADKFEEQSKNLSDKTELINIQRALSYSFYFLYEFFRSFLTHPFNQNNNYVKLGRIIKRDKSTVLTLNYKLRYAA